MLLIAGYVLLYFLVSGCVLAESGPPLAGKATGRCDKCQYELAGLPQDAPCPECGSMEREVKGAQATIDPARRARWLPTLGVFLVVLFFQYQLAQGVLILSYLRDHFSTASALTAMRMRELNVDGAGPMGVLLPLGAVISFTPLTALCRSNKRAMRWLVGLWGAGAAATVLVWTARSGYS
jgi:hypothetical protein